MTSIGFDFNWDSLELWQRKRDSLIKKKQQRTLFSSTSYEGTGTESGFSAAGLPHSAKNGRNKSYPGKLCRELHTFLVMRWTGLSFGHLAENLRQKKTQAHKNQTSWISPDNSKFRQLLNIFTHKGCFKSTVMTILTKVANVLQKKCKKYFGI